MARHGMPAPGTRVLVALSGGADSVALLLALRQLGYCCIAAHCNFHLRGEESMRDEQFVRDLCRDLGTQLEVTDFDVPARMAAKGISTEMACRELRYEWFEEVRQARQCHCIAVAHHSDDNAETLLLNLLRGTGLAGAAGIKPVNGHIIRPLLCVSRHDIEEYLKSAHQGYVTDSTNAIADVKRNRLRNIVLPVISAQFPSAKTGLARSIDNLLSCHELYAELLSRRLAEVVAKHPADGCTEVDIEAINAARGAEALLFEAMHPWGFNSTQVAEMLAAYRRGDSVGKSFLSGNFKATIGRRKITVAENIGQQLIPIDLNSGCTIAAAPITLKIQHLDARDFDLSVCDGRHRVCFGPGLAQCGSIVLRHWQEGDRFKPFGMHGRSRLVSDLFTDLKVDDATKRRTWLLQADGEIIWVVGYRSGDLYSLRPTDGSVYFLTAE